MPVTSPGCRTAQVYTCVMGLLAYLVSSARNLPLEDGSHCAAGWLSADELLWAYERFATAGIDTIIVTPDGRPPTTEVYGNPAFFQCPAKDRHYAASLVATFADHVEDIHLTSQQYVELGLMGARRVSDMLQGRGWSALRAHEVVSRAANKSWRQNEPLARVLVGDISVGLSYEEVAGVIDAHAFESDQRAEQTRSRLMAVPGFRAPSALTSMTPEHIALIDALFVPGGYGSLVDLCEDDDVGRLVRDLHRRGAPIATVGHGAAALLSAPERPDGQWLFEGYTLTSITGEEEDQTPVGRRGMNWRLDVALKDAGAVFDDAQKPWTSHVVVDRHLLTGQNPASTDATVGVMLAALRAPATRPGPALDTSFSPVRGTLKSLRSPRDVVESFLSALNELRLDDAMTLVSARVSVTAPPLKPTEGDGGAQLRKVLVSLSSGTPDFSVDVRKVIVTSGSVTALFRVGGWQTTDQFGTSRNRRFDLEHAWRFEVSDGLITDVAAYWCQAQQLRRMGVDRYERVATA